MWANKAYPTVYINTKNEGNVRGNCSQSSGVSSYLASPSKCFMSPYRSLSSLMGKYYWQSPVVQNYEINSSFA